jgi:hypothetical protein
MRIRIIQTLKVKSKFIVILFVVALSCSGEVWCQKYEDDFSCRAFGQMLGGGFKPSCNSKWVRKNVESGEIAFNINFSTDQYGRRDTINLNTKEKDGTAIFFGGSFCLGAGVQNNETMLHYFSHKYKEINVYNYCGSGFGPGQMLAYLTEMNLKPQLQIVDENTIGIYTFLGFHVHRAVGSPNTYFYFSKYFPYYTLNHENKIVRKGNFKTGRFISKFYDLIEPITFLRDFVSKVSDRYSAKDVELTGRIIEESFINFKEQFKSNKFVVVIYPGSSDLNTKGIISYLKKSNIRYLDYSELVDMSDPKSTVGDGHPSAFAHKVVGERVAKDLENWK